MSAEECRSYSQLNLIDMKTKQLIWYSYSWYNGFGNNESAKAQKKKEESLFHSSQFIFHFSFFTFRFLLFLRSK